MAPRSRHIDRKSGSPGWTPPPPPQDEPATDCQEACPLQFVVADYAEVSEFVYVWTPNQRLKRCEQLLDLVILSWPQQSLELVSILVFCR